VWFILLMFRKSVSFSPRQGAQRQKGKGKAQVIEIKR